jgi:integrase
MVRRYIKQRQTQNASPATINRELAILKAAFNLAMESTPPKVRTVPFIPMFSEKNVRIGFLADTDQAKLARECAVRGLWLRTAFAIGYTFGWRLSEILGLRVRQVDLADRTVRLEAGTTKNGHGRIVSLTEECFTLLQACCLGKKQDDYVLTRDHGKRVLDFRGAWQSACVRAELGRFVCRACEQEVTKKKCKCGSLRRKYDGLLFHDLRRTAVRNLRRLGVAESVAMKISGHKTASVFRRYDIVEMADLAEAAARLDTKQKSNANVEISFGQSSDRVAENRTKTDAAADSKMITPVLPN